MLDQQQRDGPGNRDGGKAQHALDHSRDIFSLLVLEIWHKEFRAQEFHA